MDRTKWIERKFNFDFPLGLLPNILERLRGTGARVIALTNSISNETAQFKPGNKWSIKEHIGHLCDLEELHDGRIDDFISGRKILRAADMDNKKTNQANHNQRDLGELVQDFITKRNQFVSRLEKLDDVNQQTTSIHPRLQVTMRPVDMAFFTAEHDDHHLASIREILNILHAG